MKIIANKFGNVKYVSYLCLNLKQKIMENNVKRLSREEIESAGWEYVYDNIYRLSNWTLKHHVDNTISIIIRDPSLDEKYMIKGVMTSVHYITLLDTFEIVKLMDRLKILK